MTQRDIPFALDITDGEGWGYTRQDLQNILELEPDGCYVAFDGDERIGMLTTINYGRTAWIGNVVTRSDRRGQGIASRVVLHAVEYLRSREVHNMGLFSYTDSIEFYKRIGFKESFRVSWLSGTLNRIKSMGSTKTGVTDLQAISEFDRRFFPGERNRLLGLMHVTSPDHFYHVRKDDILGYVTGFCSPKACEIGPWVCNPDHPEVAEDLLIDCLSSLDGEETSVGIPNDNEIAMSLARDAGFDKDFEVAAMFFETDENQMNLEAIFGVGSLEMG